jgi:hypothetical protein
MSACTTKAKKYSVNSASMRPSLCRYTGAISWTVLSCSKRFSILGGALWAASTWAADFVRWYNVEHHHSGIRYVSPAERHEGRDHAILAARHLPYLKARERNPARWSGDTRNWTPIGAVTLNPEPDSVVNAHLRSRDQQPLAA